MESSFLKMDIFFLVTTVVVVLLGTLLAVLLYQLIRVLQDVREITDTVKHEAHAVVHDFHEVREDVKEGIATAKHYTKAIAGASIVRGISALFEAFTEAQSPPRTKKTRTSRKKKADEE
jgi:Na+-driven multidrug efflux pump